uniref:Uncharacterized protein n=1 Tax=Anopheles minimus TaxID=112268 RepID=A0A182WPD2_9DIPT
APAESITSLPAFTERVLPSLTLVDQHFCHPCPCKDVQIGTLPGRIEISIATGNTTTL